MKTTLTLTILYIVFWIYTAICWVINLIQLLNCDFEAPYKEEIIKTIGVIASPTAGVTVWF